MSMKKYLKIGLWGGAPLLILVFFLPTFLTHVARDLLPKQFPNLEITFKNLSLTWFSTTVQEVTVKPRHYSGTPLRVKNIHVSFYPWELAHKKVKDIIIEGLDLTYDPETEKSIRGLLQPSVLAPSTSQTSKTPVSSEKQSEHPFSFKMVKVRDFHVTMKKGSDEYTVLLNIKIEPLQGDIKGKVNTILTSPYGTIKGKATFLTSAHKITGKMNLTAQEIHHGPVKIESPKMTLEVNDQPFNDVQGSLMVDVKSVTYEYHLKNFKLPIRIPNGHLEGPVHIITQPDQKTSFHMVGSLGGMPLDLTGRYDFKLTSGWIDLKPIKIPLKASWLESILPHISPLENLNFKALDGALSLQSSLEISKGNVIPHYSIKVEDTGRVVTAVVEDALKTTLKNTLVAPEKAVKTIGSLVEKLFS